MKNVNSINELIKRFEEIVLEESNLIRNGSIVALKHVATGKYLSSIKNLCYTTGSRNQLVFVGSSEPIPNSLWKIEFGDELAAYTDNSIKRDYYKSPSTNHTEVSCKNTNDGYWNGNWKFNHSKLENYQGHDIQITIGNDAFQEVVCHNERLGGNDEWCIELIHEVKIF
ncbi:unnamed protein product [Rhizophagus irregularis]|nr:unnamed protein product [Rhizophagus irregularis]